MSPNDENDKNNWAGKKQQISNKVTAKLLKLQAAKLHHIVATVKTFHFYFTSIVFKYFFSSKIMHFLKKKELTYLKNAFFKR